MESCVSFIIKKKEVYSQEEEFTKTQILKVT